MSAESNKSGFLISPDGQVLPHQQDICVILLVCVNVIEILSRH